MWGSGFRLRYKGSEDETLPEGVREDGDVAGAAATEEAAVSFDPGLTQQYTKVLKRVINKDGQFNVWRVGRTWHDWHLYLFLISAPWPLFFSLVVMAFAIVNTLFAG